MAKARANRRHAGIQQERDLALRLWEMGFAVIRGPASGARAKRILYPDLVAIRTGKIYAFEVKTRISKKPIYVEKRQVEKLSEFVKRAGGRAFIAVKIVGETDWKLIPIELLKSSGGKSYKVDEESLSRSLSIRDIYSEAVGTARLDKYFEGKPGEGGQA